MTWIATTRAADLLGCTPHYISHLARTGQLPSRRDGRSLLVDEAAVHKRAETAAQWVSYERAAKIVGCSSSAIVRAVQRGRIERRPVEHRAQPALSRQSVDEFARAWAAQKRASARRRVERAARRIEPPDDEHVWLSPSTAALVLGVSASGLRLLARQDRVPFAESGGRRWYRRDHVERLCAARRLRRDAVMRPPSE